MVCLLVGADKIGKKEEHLEKNGLKTIIHWDGRTRKLPPMP